MRLHEYHAKIECKCYTTNPVSFLFMKTANFETVYTGIRVVNYIPYSQAEIVINLRMAGYIQSKGNINSKFSSSVSRILQVILVEMRV